MCAEVEVRLDGVHALHAVAILCALKHARVARNDQPEVRAA